MAACVWQAASVTLEGQFITAGVAAVTVKVAVQVLLASQELVTVKVTVFEPPQAAGAPVLLLDNTPLQPPVKLAVANQVANFASI